MSSYTAYRKNDLGNAYVGPEHLLLALIRVGNNRALDLLVSMNVDINNVKQKIESFVRTDMERTYQNFNKSAVQKIAGTEARSFS